jgi:hypothetical protein
MSASASVFYLIVAALTFSIAMWVNDQVMMGFSIGIATTVCACAIDAWTQRKPFNRNT